MITTNIKTLFGAKLVPYGSSIKTYSGQVHIHGPVNTGIALDRCCQMVNGFKYVFEVSCNSALTLLLRHDNGKEIQKKFLRTCAITSPDNGDYQIFFLKTRRAAVTVASIIINNPASDPWYHQNDIDDLSALLMNDTIRMDDVEARADATGSPSSIICFVSDYDINELIKEIKNDLV